MGEKMKEKRFPRTRGDEPDWTDFVLALIEFSPHTRG